MLNTFRNAWKTDYLRKKLLFTLFIIIVFRVGSVITVPFIDADALRTSIANATTAASSFFNYLAVLTGGGLDYGAVFAMSVTPYINASIILNLLTVAIPALERLAKEGEEGQKKIAQITRYATVILALIQGTSYYFYLRNERFLSNRNWFAAVVIITCLTAGSAIVMWLGEQIDAKGIGNGISILLFSGILARAPQAVRILSAYWSAGRQFAVIAIAIVFLLTIAFIVWMTNAERRIPIQYAKRVVGRKMYGGQNTHLPIKVNMSGVMPIIFASSILSIPTMIVTFMGTSRANSFWYKFFSLFSPSGLLYSILYFLFIIGFAYFYVTIQYNPVEIANNLRKNSGAIPGIRPGKPTSDFISRILSRITLLGALFLSVIAILPIIIGNVSGVAVQLGGTSVLIVVGVALETVQSIESQMMMRHYKGFLD